MPITICEEIDIGPSDMAAQFGPTLPSARLKSSEPGVVVMFAQEMAMLLTSAAATVPEPLEIEQFWLAGAVFTVTL